MEKNYVYVPMRDNNDLSKVITWKMSETRYKKLLSQIKEQMGELWNGELILISNDSDGIKIKATK